MYISMKMITGIVPRIRDVNKIIAGCSSGTMPFEQAFALARFYYDFQDTNAIIAEAEAMVVENQAELRDCLLSLKARTLSFIEGSYSIVRRWGRGDRQTYSIPGHQQKDSQWESFHVLCDTNMIPIK